jgi:hypothetical protein
VGLVPRILVALVLALNLDSRIAGFLFSEYVTLLALQVQLLLDLLAGLPARLGANEHQLAIVENNRLKLRDA